MTDRYVSLYSGAGGLDLGMARAGLKPALVIDADPYACATVRSGMPGAPVMEADIHDVLNAGVLVTPNPPLLAVGQPPVVRGKVYGKQDVHPEDDAPQLLFRFLDAVAQMKPAAFVMFGIPALASRRWHPVVTSIRHTARELGYDLFTPVLDASDFGVPQRRDRTALIGMPKGCKPDISAAPKRPRTAAGPALSALPAGRDTPCPASVRPAPGPVLRDSPYAGQLLNGFGRMLDLRKTAPVISADLGGNKTPVLDLDQLESGAVPWIEGYHQCLWEDKMPPVAEFPAGVRMRRLSLRECAALQGFPPAYPFCGPPLSQFRQCGSAVPPAMAEAVGRAVLAGLS